MKINSSKKIVISILVTISYISSFMIRDVSAIGIPAYMNNSIDLDQSNFACLDTDTFSLPAHLGEIKDIFKGESESVVIHIQDAHCNYPAQKKISSIIDYIVKEYGIEILNMEGASESYDLTPFTSIVNKDLRSEVSEYFLKKGEINGAEFYAINNEKEIELWGVENREAYLKNLSVYRESLKYDDNIKKVLDKLSNGINELKKGIYNKNLLEFDISYIAYKSGKKTFREYVGSLTEQAEKHGISLELFPNISKFSATLDLEEKIDFKKSTRERDILISDIKNNISPSESRELISKTLEFRTRIITRKEFYSYIFSKAVESGFNMERFPALKAYMEYISMYEQIDHSRILDETECLEDSIKDTFFENNEQRKLSIFSKKLIILTNILNFSLTKKDYDYYINNKKEFLIKSFLDFMKEKGSLIEVSEDMNSFLQDMDNILDAISRFYEYSFERDIYFLENMRYTSRERGGKTIRAALIMTGGFHSDNLCSILREYGISYISILPKFTSIDRGINPYFALLSGTNIRFERMIGSILAETGMIQIASKLSPVLSESVWDRSDIDIFRLAIKIQEYVGKGEGIEEIEFDGNNMLLFTLESGKKIKITLKEFSDMVRSAGFSSMEIPLKYPSLEIYDDILELIERPLDGNARGFTDWTDAILDIDVEGLTKDDFIRIGRSLGMPQDMIENAYKGGSVRAKLASAFLEELPEDGKEDIFLLRDAFALYSAEKLQGKNPRAFYLSKASFGSFSGGKRLAYITLHSLVIEAKNRIGLKEKDTVPPDLYSDFKSSFTDILEALIRGREIPGIKNSSLYQAREDLVTAEKNIKRYWNTMGLSDTKLRGSGIRIIDTTKNGTFVLLLEALHNIWLRESGMERASASEKIDSKMAFSAIAPGILGVFPSLPLARALESVDYPVEYDRKKALDPEGIPIMEEVASGMERKKYILGLLSFKKAFLDKGKETDKEEKSARGSILRPAAAKISELIRGIGLIRRVNTLVNRFNKMLPPPVSFAVLTITLVLSFIFAPLVPGEYYQSGEFYEKSSESLETPVFSERALEITGISGIDMERVLPSDFNWVDPGVINRSIQVSNSKKYRDLVKATYDLLEKEGIWKRSWGHFPVFFLEGLNVDSFAMALEFESRGKEIKLVLVGLDVFEKFEKEGRSLTEELAAKIAHEARHLYNHKVNPYISPLEDEALAYQITADVTDAWEKNPEQRKAQRMVSDAFIFLVENADIISRVMETPFSRIYYKDIRIFGNLEAVDIELYDLYDPYAPSQLIRVDVEKKELNVLIMTSSETSINYEAPVLPDLSLPGNVLVASAYNNSTNSETASLIGKLVDKNGNIIEKGIECEEISDSGNRYLELNYEGNTLSKLRLSGKTAEKEKLLGEFTRGVFNRKIKNIKRKDIRKIVDDLIGILSSENVKEIVLMKNDMENTEVKGLFSGGKLYISEDLYENPMVLLHELGEGYADVPDGYSMTRHTLMRGAGKDLRRAFERIRSSGKDISALSPDDIISELQEELVKLKEAGLISKERVVREKEGKGMITESEKELIRYNKEQKDAEKSEGIAILYGVQDHIDPEGNIALTAEIKAITDDMKRNTLNIFIIPYGDVEARRSQEIFARKTGRRFTEKGINTMIFHFDGIITISEQLTKALNESYRKENVEKVPKIYIDTVTPEQVEEVKQFIKIDPESGKKRTEEEFSRLEKMLVIGRDSLPEGMTTDNLKIDDVRVITIASAILNDNRLRRDFGLSPERLAENRRRMLSAFKSAGIIDIALDPATAAPEELEGIMQNLYYGRLPIKITPVNWSDIRSYNDSMNEVLRSL